MSLLDFPDLEAAARLAGAGCGGGERYERDNSGDALLLALRSFKTGE